MLHYGWRSSFWACAIIGLIAGAVWYLMARDAPAEHPHVSAVELETIRSGLPIETGGTDDSDLLPWRVVFRSREVQAITASYFCFGYTAWMFFSWFFIYLAQVRGLNLKASAFYAMLPPVAMSVCSFVGGAISDALTKWRGPRLGRCGVATFGIALAGIFLAFGSQVDSARVGQPGTRGRCWSPLSVTEFVLVGECRHCRQGVRFGFRLHEHGGPDWRSSHRVADARNCSPLWLDRVIPCGRGAVSAGSGGVAGG